MVFFTTIILLVSAFVLCILSFVQIQRKQSTSIDLCIDTENPATNENLAAGSTELSSNQKKENCKRTRFNPIKSEALKQAFIFDKNKSIVTALSLLLIGILSYRIFCFNVDYFAIASVLMAGLFVMAAAIVDFYIKKIPNIFVVFMFVFKGVLLVIEYVVQKETIFNSLLNSLVGLFIFFTFFFAISFFSKGGIGMGDVKLLGALGFFVGVTGTLYTVLFSFILSAIVSACLILTRKKGRKDEIPFGPFIFIGYIVTIFIGRF